MRTMALCLVIIGLMAGCVSYGYAGRVVTRTDTDTTVDLSGRWNDADSRITAQKLSRDLVTGAWLTRFTIQNANGKLPVVIVGGVRNLSSEHISVVSFVKDIERAMVNSGRVQVVASSAERIELRSERLDQQEQSSQETRARLREETGADFMIIGTLTSQTDAISGQKVVLYQVDLELISIESNTKVWIGSAKIKKEVSQDFGGR